MSVDCDCAGLSAAKPTIANIGILASTDILAIDQACVDLVYSHTKDNHDLVERMESRHGLRQLSAMAEHKMGNTKYELIEIDKFSSIDAVRGLRFPGPSSFSSDAVSRFLSTLPSIA